MNTERRNLLTTCCGHSVASTDAADAETDADACMSMCLSVCTHTQIMRFDVQTLPLGATAHPFNLQAQEALNTALAADYAATVTPIVTPTTPIRQVSWLPLTSSEHTCVAPGGPWRRVLSRQLISPFDQPFMCRSVCCCHVFPCCTLQVSLLENLDAATGFPLEVLLGTATNNANGLLNTATPQLWMDPVGIRVGGF